MRDVIWPTVRTVALDLEVTSLNRERDRVIMYGVYGVDASGAELCASAAVDAEVTVGRDPRNLPDVSPEELRRAKPMRVGHLDRLFDMLNGAVVVMHNAAHDWSFVEAEFRRAGRRPPCARRRVCTLRLAKHVLKIPSADRRGRPSHRLGDLAAYLDVPLEVAHNALHDARATFWVYVTLINRFWWRYAARELRDAAGGRSRFFALPPMLEMFEKKTHCWRPESPSDQPACGVDLHAAFAR